ncbi:MAG: AAA family ATPase [Candidatus Norongarragalinales archaeon]
MAGVSFKELTAPESLVFRDKSVLSPHYVPETLLNREREIRALMQALAPALSHKKPSNVFLYGKTGSGKTACTRYVLHKLEEEKVPGVFSVYMNCRIYDSRYKVLQKTITSFCPDFAKTGYSFAVLYEKLLDWIEAAGGGGGEAKLSNAGELAVPGKQVVLALDEIDMVRDLDNLVYTLTRVNDDLKCGGLSVIGISNKVGFKQRLEARSKSSLCEQELVFQSYNARQLQEILRQRARLAFKQGVVEESALNLAAAIAASENGDARYALSLLLRAGELAETRRSSTPRVTDKEVEASRRAADEDKAFEVMNTLPVHQQLLLYAIASIAEDVSYKKLVDEGGEKLYFSGEVYERYARAARKFGRDPRTSRWYREYLHDLENLGLVNTVESGKGVRGHTTLIKLAYEPAKVRRVLEKTLSAAGESTE